MGDGDEHSGVGVLPGGWQSCLQTMLLKQLFKATSPTKNLGLTNPQLRLSLVGSIKNGRPKAK